MAARHVRAAACTALVALCLASLVCGDVYMHNPRGSNNRNREQQRNVQNQNRLFDSQNNAAGGYHWGPPMTFYAGSMLMVEWTNQHGCGGSQGKVRCNQVIQYMCHDLLRDGVTTETPPNDPATVNEEVAPGSTGDPYYDAQETIYRYGYHEPVDFYDKCATRQRNVGLFLADQNVNSNSATRTRQNNNGDKHGLECPEERDYYPYWHPTPWIDIAVLTDEIERCEYYEELSENVLGRHECSLAQHNNESGCINGGGEWLYHSSHDMPTVDCRETMWTRDNHLGNGVDGYTSHYNWTIPEDVTGQCTLRIRYNISSGDYDGWSTYAETHPDGTPIKNNPTLPHSVRNLTYAINTAQFGRTFEDRSHMFHIIDHADDVSKQARIWNVNVRGKRGNIVQVYPSVEYDFVPQLFEAVVGDYVHFQWTGSDDNPTGRAGEGRDQTDRSNVVMMSTLDANHPAPFGVTGFFESDDDEFVHAHLGQTGCKSEEDLGNPANNQQDPQNCHKLNNATRRFDGGLIRIESRHNGQTYNYMSSRNNNFTNRSQKGQIVVLYSPDLSPFLIAAIGIAVFGGTVVIVTPLALLAPTLITAIAAGFSQRL